MPANVSLAPPPPTGRKTPHRSIQTESTKSHTMPRCKHNLKHKKLYSVSYNQLGEGQNKITQNLVLRQNKISKFWGIKLWIIEVKKMSN